MLLCTVFQVEFIAVGIVVVGFWEPFVHCSTRENIYQVHVFMCMLTNLYVNKNVRIVALQKADQVSCMFICGVTIMLYATFCVIKLQVAIELVKVVKNAPAEHYKNAFLNLALPLFVFSEPAPGVKSRMRLYV